MCDDSAIGEAFDLNDRPLTPSRMALAALFGIAGLGMLYLAVLYIREGMFVIAVPELALGIVGLLFASSVSGVRFFQLSSAIVAPGRVEVFSALGSRVYLAGKDRVCVYAWPRTRVNVSANAVIVLGETDGKRAIVTTDHDNAIRFLRLWTTRTFDERVK